MIQRVIIFCVVVMLLAGLLAYSKIRPEPRKVSGFIEADEIRVGSRIGGRVAEVTANEGQAVKAGTELVRLEPFDLGEREAQAVANLAVRQAELDRVNHDYQVEEVAQAKARHEQLVARLELLKAPPRDQEVAAAQAYVDAAQAQLELAQQTLKRTREAFEKNATTSYDLDRAVEELKAARAMKVVRDKELELLKLGARQEEIRVAEAQVEEAKQAWLLMNNGFRTEDKQKAQAARDAAREALNAIKQHHEELTIKAPVDGVVEAMELQKGDLVSAGAPVLSLMDSSNLWIRAYVPERMMKLKVGDLLRVTVTSLHGEEFQAKVTYISRQAEFTPSNVQTPEERSKQVFRIKATLETGLETLRAGMSADIWLD